MEYKFNVVEKVEGESRHHLFDYYDVRDKLIELFGKPNDEDEHDVLHKRIKKCMNVIPVFIIDENKHKDYHLIKNEGRKEANSERSQ